MKKYNIFEDKSIELTKIGEDTSCSLYKDTSSFLRSAVCRHARTRFAFCFLTTASPGEVRVFCITITRQRFTTIYYGHDATAFCLVRSAAALRVGARYIIYARLSKNRHYFVDCLEAAAMDYRELCYWLL